MKINRFFIVIWLLHTLIGSTSVAQNRESQLLVDFLPVLEKQFDVVFSFADDNIKGIYVAIPYKSLSMDECLVELEKQTHLNFQKLNSRYIAIGKMIGDIRVSGRIVDRFSKECLVGAVIYSNNKSVFSDAEGCFSIKVNSNEDSILTVRHTGYKIFDLKRDSWSSDSSRYELIPDVQILKEVVVNYLAKGLEKLPFGSIQMNVQNIEVLPGLSEPDVLHAVQVLPGIQSVNETVSNINTRGGANDQNLVLWDGVKMYQTGHFFGLISAFNSHLIHKTKIIKNGTSAAFEEGVSGTIDMQQQNYHVNHLDISTGLNMVSADMIIKTPITQKLSLILGARHSINDIVLTPTYKSYYDRAFDLSEVLLDQQGDNSVLDDSQDFSFYDLSCKLLYDVSEKDKVRLSILNINNSIEYEENAIVQDTLRRKKSHLSQWSTLANLNYTHLWSEKHITHLSAFVSNYNLDGTNVSILDNQHHLQKNEVIDWGIKVETKNNIFSRVDLLCGYQFKEVGIRNQDNIRSPNYRRDVKDVLRIHSLYSEVAYKELFQDLNMRVGLRSNYFTKFNEFSLEPRVALNFNLSKCITFEALAEMKSQYTTQQIDYQTDFLGVENRRWVLSNNESVPLIKSHQYSIGMQYNRNSFLVTLEGYKKKVRGIITPSQGFQNQYQYVYGIGKYDTYGLELLVNKRFINSNFWINYALAKNDYCFPEFIPSVFPSNFDVRHTISLGGSYNIRNFEVSGGFNFRTGKPYTIPSQQELNTDVEIVYAEPNSSRLNNYIRFDISAQYKFKFHRIKGKVGVSFWNLLDRENVINVFYRPNDNNGIEPVTQNALGFTPNLNLRIKLF